MDYEEKPEAPLHVKRDGSVMLYGSLVAHVHRTGTHLDHYPWDWYLADGVFPFGERRTTGVTDTRQAALGQIAYALGYYGYIPPRGRKVKR